MKQLRSCTKPTYQKQMEWFRTSQWIGLTKGSKPNCEIWTCVLQSGFHVVLLMAANEWRHSVFLCFSSSFLQSTVNVGYLIFKHVTRPYNASSMRCFQCNRYSHKAKYCKGSVTCARCGLKHEYFQCQSQQLGCSKSQVKHSAGYADAVERKWKPERKH